MPPAWTLFIALALAAAPWASSKRIKAGDANIGAMKVGTLLSGESEDFQKAVLEGFDIRNPPASHSHWRDCIMPFRPQGGCGSCWIFAYSRAFAERLCIATGGRVKAFPSFEQLNECTDSDDNKRCSGSTKDAASTYMSSYGAVADAHIAYTASKTKENGKKKTKQACPLEEMHQKLSAGLYKKEDKVCAAMPVLFKSVRQATGEVRRYISSPLAIMRELFYNGPVYISSTQSRGGHGVVLHGWGADGDGDFFWIIANSQGKRVSGTRDVERTLNIYMPEGDASSDSTEDDEEMETSHTSVLQTGGRLCPHGEACGEGLEMAGEQWYLQKGNVELYDQTSKKNRKKHHLMPSFKAIEVLESTQTGTLSDYTWRSYDKEEDDFGDIAWHVEKAQAVRPDYTALDLVKYSARPVMGLDPAGGQPVFSVHYRAPENRSPNDWLGLYVLGSTVPVKQQRLAFDRLEGGHDWCQKAAAVEGKFEFPDLAFGSYSIRIFLDHSAPDQFWGPHEASLMAEHSQITRVDFKYSIEGVTLIETDWAGWGTCNAKTIVDILFDGADPMTGKNVHKSSKQTRLLCKNNPRILPLCMDKCSRLWPEDPTVRGKPKPVALAKSELLSRLKESDRDSAQD